MYLHELIMAYLCGMHNAYGTHIAELGGRELLPDGDLCPLSEGKVLYKFYLGVNY